MKKKITIFTSIGGGGQVSINTSLTEQLQNSYDIDSVLFFSRVLGSIDPFSFISRGNYTSEDFYNDIQKFRVFRFLQGMHYASQWYFSFFESSLIERTAEYLQQEKPDLVISIIPIVNRIIEKACAQLNIPFLILPPDLDISFFVDDFEPPYRKNFYLALPFDNELSRESFAPAEIPQDQVLPTQYPLRKDFFEKKNIKEIKHDFNITDEKPVVLLMMGAQGNRGSYTFAKQLTELEDPIHLIIAIGKNERIRKDLESLTFPAHITPHIIGYTDRISDLMAISTLMISKTGAVSVLEALYSGTILIGDQTSYVLSWELFNQFFLEKYQCGFILPQLDELVPLVHNLLSNPTLIKETKENITRVLDMQKGIPPTQLIDTILKKK